MPITFQEVLENYKRLSSADPILRQNANNQLINLVDYPETWNIAYNIIQDHTLEAYRFLGCQLLYQKIQKEAHRLDVPLKKQIITFVFDNIAKISQNASGSALIDRLASCIGLLVCYLYPKQWPTLIDDIMKYMQMNEIHVKCGLVILQRIAEELIAIEKISYQAKKSIKHQLEKERDKINSIVLSVFKANQFGIPLLKCINSWVNMGYELMQENHIVQCLLMVSLESYDQLELSMKILVQTLKNTSQNRSQTLAQAEITSQQSLYTESQLTSLKYIITYIIKNYNNFMNSEIQYIKQYIQICKQIILSYGFILLNQLYYDIVNVIVNVTSHQNLKLSYSCFQFWMDFCDKFAKIALKHSKVHQELSNTIKSTICTLFDGLIKKAVLPSEQLLCDVDLKEDDTFDDMDTLTFSQYRKQLGNTLRYVYDYLKKTCKQDGTAYYFSRMKQLLEADQQPSIHTQLCIFCVRACLELMLNTYEVEQLLQIISYIISQQESKIPPLIVGESLKMIRECSNEIRNNESILMKIIDYIIRYIDNEQLSHNSSYTFKVLMEGIQRNSNKKLIGELVSFYLAKQFRSEIILQRILEGVLQLISKIKEEASQYYKLIVLKILKDIQNIEYNNPDQNDRLFIPLFELKTILAFFLNGDHVIKNAIKVFINDLAAAAFGMVGRLMPIYLQAKFRYSNINQLGLLVTVFKYAVKISPKEVNSYLPTLDIILRVLNRQLIREYYPILSVWTQPLIELIGDSTPLLTQYVRENYSKINGFFFSLLDQQKNIDPDVLRTYFLIQQSILLYNSKLFFQLQQHIAIQNILAFLLKNAHEKLLQKKIVSCLYMIVQYQNEIQQIQLILKCSFQSLYVLNSICYINMAKIFIIIVPIIAQYYKQSINDLLNKLMSVRQFDTINHTYKTLFVEIVQLGIQNKVQRFIKAAFIDLAQLYWKKTKPGMAMQMELKLKAWKKQMKKK